MSPTSKPLIIRSAWNLVPLLGVLVATLAPLADVSANGPHMRPEEVYSGVVGAYTIRVEAIPAVGAFHMTAFVFDATTNALVSDATIEVTGRRSESGVQAGPALGTYLDRPAAYSVTVPVKEPGDWVFTMVVSSTLGEETVDMTVLVRDASEINWTIIGMAVVLSALLLWFTGKALRRQVRTSRLPKRCKKR